MGLPGKSFVFFWWESLPEAEVMTQTTPHWGLGLFLLSWKDWLLGGGLHPLCRLRITLLRSWQTLFWKDWFLLIVQHKSISQQQKTVMQFSFYFLFLCSLSLPPSFPHPYFRLWVSLCPQATQIHFHHMVMFTPAHYWKYLGTFLCSLINMLLRIMCGFSST